MFNWYRVARYFLLCVTGTFLMMACGFRHPPPTEREQVIERDAFIADGGYAVARLFDITQVRERWEHDGNYLDITLLVPDGSDTYPLIVYLPGLGEQADSGRLWREYWAKAGYVVLSIQPQTVANAFADLKPVLSANLGKDPIKEEDDEDGLKSAEELDDIPKKGNKRPTQTAQNAELRYIGREYFAEGSLKEHMEQVLWAYKHAQQFIRAKQSLFAQADLSNVWIVGYDIGAQIAATLLCEQSNVALPKEIDFKPQGAILISPIVDASSGKSEERYRKINLPLLVISSEQDDDPYGITTPLLRRAVWNNAASDPKYLLLLKQANHQLLSGSGWRMFRRGFGMPSSAKDIGTDFSNIERFRDNTQQNGGAPPGGQRPPFSGVHSAIPVYQEVAAIASVSTAFMDSNAKKDMFAALWLIQHAQSWLQSVANLNIEQHRY